MSRESIDSETSNELLVTPDRKSADNNDNESFDSWDKPEGKSVGKLVDEKSVDNDNWDNATISAFLPNRDEEDRWNELDNDLAKIDAA